MVRSGHGPVQRHVLLDDRGPECDCTRCDGRAFRVVRPAHWEPIALGHQRDGEEIAVLWVRGVTRHTVQQRKLVAADTELRDGGVASSSVDMPVDISAGRPVVRFGEGERGW